MADKTINKEDFKFIDETYTFSNILYKINKSMNPLSSSCDIISCLMGPINFSYKSIETIFIREKYLILGSFGKSTSTRFMLTFIKDLNWSKVKLLNKSIIFERNKISYEKYLDEIAFLSDIIVPKAQYNILKETFRFNILGCGISGAGGEDAVWVITNNKDELVKFWKKKFSIVFACNLIDHGLKEYD
ncbi:mevalonate kinase-like protein [Vairimorpha apis BRL 01]|uniref:Mevalonate kinase-like protein n=1 Tax=Vairimorpha apis BRL 01 TaxID=1037528 RepID=T0L9L4_9MICR|nr:mevalonate kinase-like protein [Vairimorpha apis BRL 01]